VACSTESRSLVFSSRYLVSNGRRVLLGDTRLGGSTTDLLLLDDDKPATYAEAMMDLDFEKWQSAMRSEIDSMSKNQVWNLVD
jgi:hypothetical protein